MPTETTENLCLNLLAKARISLIRSRTAPGAFFGTLVMRLVPVIDNSCETAATDGKHLFIGPAFWNSLNDKERVGVLCHEVLHCSNKHMCRRCHRDPKLWNIACDLAINPIVLDAGMTLPTGGLHPSQFNLPTGKTAEWYYGQLQSQCQQGGKAGEAAGSAAADPGRCGEIRDAGQDQAAIEKASQDWDRATSQASSQAKGRGNMPGSLSANIQHVLKPKVNYWDLLHKYMTRNDRSDYSWSRPSRRFMHAGQYLPSLWSQKIGKIVVTYDTSGSCWDPRVLARFAAEVEGVRQVLPSQIVLLYHDTVIQGEPVVIESDEPFKIEPRGGGGTSHRQVFEWIEENQEDADVVICLTDLYTSFPASAPDVPVIWISIGSDEAPWGDVIHIEDQEAAV